MTIVWRKSLLIAFLAFFVPGLHAAKASDAYHRSFWQPWYHGQRLAYCSVDGKECGMAVANRYCKMMGYARADKQIIANNIGLTNYIDSPAHCRGWRCNGFKLIDCRANISHKPPKAWHYRLRRFVFPRYNNYRVDWCYDGKTQCGRKAAFSFCRRLGYMSVRHYRIQEHVAATQAIGNQKLCFGSSCNAFREIDCFR